MVVMGNSLSYHSFFFGDWYKDRFVNLLTFEEVGVYWSLLVQQMLEGDIPLDPKIQHRLLGKNDFPLDRYLQEVWPKLSSKFVPVPGKPGYLHNEMLTSTMAIDLKRHEANKNRGQRKSADEITDVVVGNEPVSGSIADRLTALKEAGGNYVTIPKKLSASEEKGVMTYDVDEWKAVGTWIANGCHWITKKEGKTFFPLSTIVRANLAGTVEDAVAMMAEVEAYEATKPPPAPKFETADEWIAWHRNIGQSIKQTPWEKNPEVADRWLPERRWLYLLEEDYIGDTVYAQHAGATE